MRHLALVVLATLAALTGSCRSNAVVCNGGAKQIGNACFCALGTSWNGGGCVGTPQAGTCTGGAYQVQDQCFCPDGTAWDQGQCLQLNCQGGAMVSGNSCVCPAGTVWQDNQCQQPPQPQCTGGASLGNDGQCYCPDGTQWDGASCIGVAPAVTTCTGGASPGNDGQCYCPAGTQWDGVNCVGAAAPPPATYEDLCYDLDCNGSKTGKQCFNSHADYCASLCASDNCLAPGACQRNCR
jgi:hypothetical protein